MIVEVGQIDNATRIFNTRREGQPVAWRELAKEYTWRQEFEGSPHKDTETVYFHMPDFFEEKDFLEAMECHSTNNLVESPDVQDVLSECMYLVGASKLGRAMLVTLPAGGIVKSHSDTGGYCEVYRRYHLPILTNDDVIFTSDGAEHHLKENMLYEIENKKSHSVTNQGTTDRIHLILDMQLLTEL